VAAAFAILAVRILRHRAKPLQGAYDGGAQASGRYGLSIQMKTRPGEQFVIRRKAHTMLKKAFEENGVKFAFPTVQLAGGTEPGAAAAAAARQMLARDPPPAAG
jgi:hypothetical protein